ncbi:MAG: succinyl-diaminopimelate desuccinylase [Bacteroidetes bacterium]|nr:succinyl-diaminopimelate desuccinylase [Bacteroidota bacterium]
MPTIETAAIQTLTEALIRAPSVTPHDAGCLDLLGARLAALGFQLERMDHDGVSNLWATWGTHGPLVCFAGHTDVVPVGHLEDWTFPPFEPTVSEGYLYGRGAADMKASLAAMIVAIEHFMAAHPDPQGRIACLFTSDEEGPATAGTVHVVEQLRKRPQPVIDYCIVGEPSSRAQVGDMIRVGRRGSLNAKITVHGRQGHVAYPELVVNPIHQLTTLIAQCVAEDWDGEVNPYFPPTSFQVSNVTAGTGATNVVPASAEALVNWRFSTSVSAEQIKARVEAIAGALGVNCSYHWSLSGAPFVTPKGTLTDRATHVIAKHTGLETECSTGGGTSDGRFIATLGCELIELGPVNATIHQVDERVALADLAPLASIYADLLTALIGPRQAEH